MEKFKVKKAKKIPVHSVTIFCTACTKKFTAIKKSDKGILIRQQFCPHAILEEVVI